MDNSQSTRPASQLIAGFASPSTPASAQKSMRHSTRPSHPQTSSHQPVHGASDAEKDELRVQVSTLRYELENIRQERELEALRHEKETRDLQLRADADFRKAQASEAASQRATHKSESLAKELKEAQDQALDEKTGLERKIRSLQDEKQNIQEEFSDVEARLSDQDRQFKYQINELETVRASLQKTIEELQNDLQSARSSQQATQEKLSEREAEVAELESENIRLKAEGSGAEELVVLKRELSDQVNHIRELESTNRDQNAELRHLRKVQKNVEVVEEQKRSLENQLQLMKGLEAELGTLQFQKQMLEDERQSWHSLLQDNDQSAEFDSPEAVVKALVQERIEKAFLVDKLGKADAQSLEKDEALQVLESEKKQLGQELEKLRAASGSAGVPAGAEARLRSRLERQRALAVKEVEYLRAQLKTFDAEEETMNTDQGTFDEQKSAQIAQLEKIVDEYRVELQQTHEELSKREAPQQNEAQAEARGTKRPLSPAESDAENERLAVLSRKNRKLQEALSQAEQSTTLARKELDAAKSQIKSLKSKSRTRILELRNNPTAEAEKIKMSSLKTLQSENRDLLAQLRGEHTGVKVVPISTLESLKLEMQDMEAIVADKEKRMRRLKEIWTAKSSEFREAVASLLGYKLDFLPNGRVRVTMGDGGENSIVFDGENGTMKISGGPNSLFAMEIKHLIKFWVEERKDIPCFLAAMTLDFYDKTTRAARM
ncbi:Mitotic checkpoint [Penicillium maclennaniae]|uniref:Mitotic checkpoint n=1 Tax=Penicillium maclennaniae TaxID=1343394 RepID=UPI002540CF8D|nr:Mitotic checkpoint [Penicillium maclennaniae]KAJ5676906.1 Mitotic checkpoint [Penicillium maclennaniae]